ncbi:hypothetical protein DNI29_02725 [Hymenobacter sediminis]|uniref:hypothetical protein n=1 Tax=Hymenobacter sediminis TaxID=2218621 RepID=UPI000F4E5398|nr:hypothetical protein [Hymenobacter sediminis]RPD49732.1 hypothetical protein DNI29_02725 [Hymenobacter sediminis]
MKAVFIKVSDIFNMSFDQVFIAGQLEGQTDFVTSGKWKLFVNGSATADLEALGERRVGNKALTDRVVAFKGQLDKTLFDLNKDEVVLVQQ